jgi:hypothetical protein
MENRDRPSFDGGAYEGGKDSSGGVRRKAPATLTGDDLTDVILKKDNDFADVSLPSTSTPTPLLNDNDDRDLAAVHGKKRLEHAPPVEPMRPRQRMVGSLERPPVVVGKDHDVSPGAFAVLPSRNTATSRTSSVPIGVYDSSRVLANEETIQDEWLFDAAGADASVPGKDLHAVEAQLVPEETMMIAEAQQVTRKWYQRPLYRALFAFSFLFLIVIIVIIVVLVVQVRPAPAVDSPAVDSPEQIACNFLSFPDVTECRSTVSIDSGNKTTGFTIPTEIGLLTQLTYLSVEGESLSASIPSEIGLLTQLTLLNLSNNKFAATIPSEIGLLTQLTYLSFSSNQVAGAIPSEIGLLRNLAWLYFSINRLSGTIPSEIGLMAKLRGLDFYDNQLSGTIPSSLCLQFDLPAPIDCDEITCQSDCCIDQYGNFCV